VSISRSVEFLITDSSAKVRLPAEIPAEVFNAHVHHHLAGHGEVSPIVRSWCIGVFRQIYPAKDFPDVSCNNFDILRLGFKFVQYL
jgi:hypothetical protein